MGAPNELEHVGSWKLRRWLSALMGKKAKSNSEVRVNLYAAVNRRTTVEVEALLAKAMQGLASEGERNMFFWTLYTTPPMVLGMFAVRTKNSLQIACQNYAVARFRILLQSGLNPDRVGLALTPLIALAAAGDVASVQKYLKNGVQADVLGEYYVGLNQRMPFHWVAIMRRDRVVETLLKHQANAEFARKGCTSARRFVQQCI
ncbi:Aste57867_21857 [Aphanomyces stellatus]|uniref:Aste57867_21857 protein n=1 Tax=Aphanomyces stellatus TaxID=120398 RepID=A0A485LIN1_9STRA|nr:hypothetical protein As57867_021788 [Aphanomyces stellatus]VFT98526.1 Aste57867_21857 [Aphanomyces stellatus]